MKTITEFNPSEKTIRFLEKKLFQHNCGEINGYAYEDHIIKTLDDNNTIVAGIHGQSGGGWLYIASLWVDEKFRHQGLGKMLLAEIEKMAARKNCHGIYLYTYSFQTPGFYETLGYQVFGRLENFCEGHSKIYMKKILE